MKVIYRGFDEADIAKIVKKLYRTKEGTFEECVKIMQSVINKLKAEAVKRVPIDTGDLEKSFSTKIIKAATRDEVVGVVYIAANALAADYALFMHEWDYNLGPRSELKQDASDVTVGRKYLERAFDENEREFGLFIYKKLSEFMKK